MNKLIEVKVNTSENPDQASKDQLEEVMNLLKEMNLVEFEPLLDEKLNSDMHQDLYLGKYRSLALLQELFLAYKDSGDTEIELEQGFCRFECHKNCSVVNLRGNNSGKNFAFVLEKEDGVISNFHNCSLYENKDRIAQKVDMGLYERMRNKQRKMKGEPPMTPKELEHMDRGIDMFYEKYAGRSEKS